MNEIALRAEGLGKKYRISERKARYETLRDKAADLFSKKRGIKKNTENTLWALKGVSFEIKPGEVVGVIGRNGAGKSTLLKILSRITEPTEGFAEIYGRVGSLLEVGTGFHNELTGRENIFLNGSILGMKKTEIRSRFDEIASFAEVEKFIDTPLKYYSSGMYMRLAFSVAAHLNPEILLIDEVLAVGDVVFQKKCLGKMEDVARQGRTVLFVSHNMGAIRTLCDKGLFLNAGKLEREGDISRVIEDYYQSLGVFKKENREKKALDSSLRFGAILINQGRDHALYQDQPFEISTSLTIPQGAAFAGFSIYCVIEDMHGRQVVMLRKESQELERGEALSGRRMIAVKFPALWLSPGLYSIYFKALFAGPFSSSARCVSDRLPLDVAGEGSAASSLLCPKVVWTFDH